MSTATLQPATRRREALRERFAASTDGVVARYHGFATSLVDAPTRTELVAALWRETHRLHCDALSHGYVDASRLAGALERRVRGWAGDPTIERAERAAIVGAFAAALDMAFDMAFGPTQ
jgi:hypothetical protein